MRSTTLLFVIISLCVFAACELGMKNAEGPAGIATDRQTSQAQMPQTTLANTAERSTSEDVSLNQADAANAASQAIARKIIRNGTVMLEISSPAESQQRIFSIAEARGGFVVTSEMSQQSSDNKSQPAQSVNLIVRVPALQFDQAMNEIRGIATRVLQEKRTGQDVTEEFIDLEARIKNQRALEAQFLEIMKRASKVEEALDVQRQLAEVRTEIEKIEGRKRFLENQATLSTINVTLQTPTQIVNATGFWYSTRSAFSDGVDAAAAIILFLIRVVIALIPILVLIVLPAALIARVVVKRARRLRRREQEVEAT